MRITINPVEEIETAYKNGNFFTGFALAVTYSEREANQILSVFFHHRIPSDIIERWSLTTKFRIVCGLNLIGKTVMTKSVRLWT